MRWIHAITFNDVQIPSSAVVDFGSGAIGAEPNTEADVNGTLSMDGGAVVLYPPFYGGASTLKYNDDYTVSTEWTKNDASASTKGVPTHVEVADGSEFIIWKHFRQLHVCWEFHSERFGFIEYGDHVGGSHSDFCADGDGSFRLVGHVFHDG